MTGLTANKLTMFVYNLGLCLLRRLPTMSNKDTRDMGLQLLNGDILINYTSYYLYKKNYYTCDY